MVRFRDSWRSLALLVVMLAAALVLAAACGDDDDDSDGGPTTTQGDGGSPTQSSGEVEIDVGGGQTVTLDASEPLSIAYFVVGTSNSYLQANVDAAKAAAAEIGATIDVFDAEFTPEKQLNQVENALESGKYNAFVFQPVSGPQACDLISKDAPDKGILVSINIAQLCDRGFETGEELWQPGTLNYVGSTTTLEYYQAWAEQIASENPGPQKVLFVVGPEGNVPVEAAKRAMQAVADENPDFEVTVVHTDYTSADGLAKTQNYLQANDDVTIVATNYAELTKGALTALDEASLGSVKVYDYGGDPSVLDAIRSGKVVMTTPYYPASAATESIMSLYDALQGKPIERVIPEVPGAQVFITADNVDTFEPEY